MPDRATPDRTTPDRTTAPDRTPAAARGRSLRVARVASHAFLVAGALVMVLPFVWQLLTAGKTLRESTVAPPVLWPSQWQWSNFARFFEALPVGTLFANSLGALVLRVVGQVLVASLAAYCLARLRFPGRKALLGVFLVVLMVPPQMFIIPQYEVVRDLGWLNTVPALALPGMFSSFGMFILYQFMRSLPAELDEAARLDGANPLQIYARIILPLCMPAIAAVTIMTALFSWNDLLWPLVINTDPRGMTLSVGLATLQGAQGTDYPVLMAGSLLAILPMVVIFVLLQKQFIRGIAMSGSK